MGGLSPLILGALMQIGLPELQRWLAQLQAEGKLVTEAAALEKLGMDVDAGNAEGLAFLASHPEP